jgi:TolB-like protein
VTQQQDTVGVLVSLWERVKSRKLVQWGAGYLVVAFGVMQGVALVTETMGWPQSIARAALMLLAAGFAIVLVIAWRHGERGHQHVSRAEIALISVFAVIGIVFATLALRPGGGDRERVQSPGGAPRLAVLRFESLGDTEPFFAEGLAEELIGEAARIRGLEVTARASSFALAGERATPHGAAEALGATLVLAGSVRRLPESIRVQAQLVEAPGGRQVWNETFERPHEQVFELQREIAVRVAQATGLRVTTRPHGAIDADAYEFYLRAQEQRRSDADVFETETDLRALFQAAVERAPEFAEAWAGLGASELGAAFNTLVSREGGAVAEADFAAAVAASQRAIELDPDLAEPYATLGTVAGMLGHWGEAAELEQKARDRGGSAFVATILLGQMAPAVETARRVLARDPLDPQNALQLAGLCELQGDVDCWRTASERAHAQLPTEERALYSLFRALVASGEPEAARRLLARGPEPRGVLTVEVLRWMIGDGPLPPTAQIMGTVPGEQMLTSAIEDLIMTGRSAEAAPYLAQWTELDRGLIANLYQPGAEALRATPEFWALMEREGLLAYWRESGRWPDFCGTEPVCRDVSAGEPQ